MGIRPLVDESDAVAEAQAAQVAAVDAGKRARMTSEVSHLLEDDQEHERSKRELGSGLELHELAASLQRNAITSV